ncbi:hypothetical protein M3175_06995 [Robertmurraya korlensis]|uniref:hypothetical protein n=1 Tax=Robertmurraya korlensis TaxID=519977 RepID=UPI00203F1286|nr:hypothetical protein [Robertmurraya korlensis]MCM3600470.1 hypothetical protein [Robertmurraya korlensis]
MNKFFFLALLFILTSLTNVINHGHIDGNAVQESKLLDYKFTDELQPFDHSLGHKQETTLQDLLLTVIIILIVTKFISLLTAIKKRYVNLTPILYQSNYVIIPPTK